LILVTNDGVTGRWAQEQRRNPLMMERAMAHLRAMGVPGESILPLRSMVTSTFEEASAVGRYACDHRFSSLVVVTSAYHSRRSLWVFRQVLAQSGIRIGIDPVPVGRQTPQTAWWWARRRGWPTVAGEYVKLPVYWWKYRGVKNSLPCDHAVS
jgi:uncharacterized SAM-binding protein YcdF (DUF218 family)